MVKVLFIGRFQPFHNGHLHTIKWLDSFGYEVIVCVGSSDKSNQKENPWTLDDRKKMLSSLPPKIVAIPDIPNDLEWVDHVEVCVGQKFDAICTRNEIVAELFRWKGYDVVSQPVYLVEGSPLTGTQIRRLIEEQKPWEHLVPPETASVIRATKRK